MNIFDSRPKILYDGNCALCKRSVQFISNHGGDAYYGYIPLQDKRATRWLKKYGYPEDYIDSVLLVHENYKLDKSDAAFEILRNLEKPWRWLYIFKVVPRPLRDAVYNFISRIRHKKFVQKMMS